MIGPSTVERGGFSTKPLGDVAEFLDHRRKPITAKDREPGPIPYYGANGQQDSVAGWLFDEPLVLLAEDGGHFETPERGVAYRIDGKSWVNNHAHVLRAGSSVDTTWLTRVLENYDVTSFITGSTRAKLTKSGAARIPIPVPPMEEQRRIAAVLDAADELRAKRRDALAKLDTLAQAIFIDMFGDASSGRARLVPLAQVVNAPITRGIDQPGPDVAGGVPYLKTTDFGGVRPRRATLARSSPNIAAKFPRSVVAAGDSVICIRATVGPTMYVDEELDGVNLSRGTARISPSEEVLPKFLFTALNSVHFQRQIKRKLRGATFLQIPLKELKQLQIPLPPLSEQERLVAAVEGIATPRLAQERSEAFLDDLFASLQQRAFRGEL